MFNKNKFYELSEPETLRWPRIPRWLYLIIIAILSILFTISILISGSILNTILNVLLTGSETIIPSATSTARRLIVTFMPLFLLVYLALTLFERRGLKSVGLPRGNAIRNYCRGLLVGFVLMGTIVLILWLLGAVTLENPINVASIVGAFIVLIGYVVQGAAEEVLFRGFLLQIFGRMTNTPFAIFVSSAIFTLLHGSGEDIGILSQFNLFLLAVFFAVYVLYEGGLWGAFGIHTIYNWAQGNLFGIEFMTQSNEGAVVLDLVRTGPELIAGGAFGLEGGIIVTLVALVGLLMLFLFGKRLQTQTNAIDMSLTRTSLNAQAPTNSAQTSKFNLKKVVGWLVGTFVISIAVMIMALTGLTDWFPFTSFEVRGEQLWLNGMINGRTVKQFNTILEENSDITTLVLEDVPGSSKDEAVIEIASMIRDRGIRTHLVSHSVVQSGGSYLVIAGSKRTMERGAEIIVHSGSDLAKEAHEYPRDAPQHESWRGYVEDMLGSDDWYWFSIYAADFAGGHSMSEAEILEYGLLTQPIIE